MVCTLDFIGSWIPIQYDLGGVAISHEIAINVLIRDNLSDISLSARIQSFSGDRSIEDIYMAAKDSHILERWLDGMPHFVWCHFYASIEDSSYNPYGIAKSETPFVICM